MAFIRASQGGGGGAQKISVKVQESGTGNTYMWLGEMLQAGYNIFQVSSIKSGTSVRYQDNGVIYTVALNTAYNLTSTFEWIGGTGMNHEFIVDFYKM